VHRSPEDVGALLDDEDLAVRWDAPHGFKDVVAKPEAEDNEILRLLELDRGDMLYGLGQWVMLGVQQRHFAVFSGNSERWPPAFGLADVEAERLRRFGKAVKKPLAAAPDALHVLSEDRAGRLTCPVRLRFFDELAGARLRGDDSLGLLLG